jgi:hypothetical protein
MWLRKADFITGILLALFGLMALIFTLNFRWDLPAVQRDGWYTAPGLLPASASALLILLGCFLAFHAFKQGGAWKREDFAQFKDAVAGTAFKRGLLTAVLLLVYAFGLVGRVHFIAGSFLFLAAFMFLFKAGSWWKILLISSVASFAIGFLFENLARIPLP